MIDVRPIHSDCEKIYSTDVGVITTGLIKCSPHRDPRLATGGSRVEVERDSEEEEKDDDEDGGIEQELKLLLGAKLLPEQNRMLIVLWEA